LEKNILCDSIKDEKKYNEILDGSAIRPDLEQLPCGDQTEIGEKVC
jgi:hypothetical protein